MLIVDNPDGSKSVLSEDYILAVYPSSEAWEDDQVVAVPRRPVGWRLSTRSRGVTMGEHTPVRTIRVDPALWEAAQAVAAATGETNVGGDPGRASAVRQETHQLKCVPDRFGGLLGTTPLPSARSCAFRVMGCR